MNVIVTGASRGIGLELVRQALERGDRVLAVARDPDSSMGLKALRGSHGKQLETLALDVQSDSADAQLARAVAAWPQVDVLINNAGIFLEGDRPEDFSASFRTNSVAPYLLTRAVLPQLKKSTQPRVAQITSLMGSVGDNGMGGYYTYRASKAALNMINKSLSLDHKWLITLVLHPGWVKTDMGGPAAKIEVADSARGLWQVILSASLNQSGQFFDFRGQELPW